MDWFSAHKKKIIILALAAAAFFMALNLRSRISNLLSFKDVPSSSAPSPSATAATSSPLEQKPENRPNVLVSPFFIYSGRDPQEVRSNAEEIKIFPAEYREKIYSKIRSNGAAVKQNPDFFNGWLEVGFYKKQIGDYEGARDAWEYVGLIRPQNGVSFANLGALYWHDLPDFPKAEKNFKAAIANSPADTSLYVSFSDFYFYSYQEKSDFAEKVLQQGLEFNPDNGNLLRALAALYERKGEFAKALLQWEKILAQNPNDPALMEKIESLKKKSAQ